MTTAKSSFKKNRFFSIYKATVKSQISFAIIIGICFILLLPLVYIVSLTPPAELGITDASAITQYFADHEYFHYGIYVEEALSGVALFAMILFALVIALVQNAYMHSKKMTDLYHSLPVKRPQLLSANMLASLTTILAPFLLVYFFTMAMQLIQYGAYISNFAQYFRYIGFDLLSILLATTVVYIFTVFVAVNVGTVFDALALTLGLGFTPMILWSIWHGMRSLLYGYFPDAEMVLLLSPFTFAFQRYMDLGGLQPDYKHYCLSMLVWVILGCVLLMGAMLCYKRRKSEIAGQTQSKGIFQTIAKVVVSLGGGMIFLLIYSVTANNPGLLMQIFFTLLGAFLIGLVGEIILSRGVRSIKKNVKWLLGAGLLGCLMLVSVKFDLTGYTTRVPAADSVQSVTSSYTGRFSYLSTKSYNAYNRKNLGLTDPEAIKILVDAHQLIVEDQPPNSLRSSDSEAYPYHWLSLEYQLKSGRTIKRQYSQINIRALQKLGELEAQDDFIQKRSYLFDADILEKMEDITLLDALGEREIPHRFSSEDRARLIEAVRSDMLAESLEEMANPNKRALGYLRIDWYTGNNYGEESVLIGAGYSATISLLTELEIIDEFNIESQKEETDTACIAPLRWVRGQQEGICPVVPGHTYFSPMEDNNRGDGNVVKIEDSEVIATLYDKGRNQLLTSGGADVFVVEFFNGNESLGSQLFRWEQLPTSVQKDLTASGMLPETSTVAVQSTTVSTA